MVVISVCILVYGVEMIIKSRWDFFSDLWYKLCIHFIIQFDSQIQDRHLPVRVLCVGPASSSSFTYGWFGNTNKEMNKQIQNKETNN